MVGQKLTDGEAKARLLGWPGRTKKLWPVPNGGGYWIRCQPVGGSATAPRIAAAGASMFKSQPDGLWAYFSGLNYCDLVAIESCGTIQNLNDKRSRYAHSGHSLLLLCSAKWFLETVDVQRGGKSPRWQACGTIAKPPSSEAKIPVRYLRVLYALPNDVYAKWCPDHIPSGHEFFCPHSSLDSYNAPKMQEFLRRMAVDSHFYTLL